MISALRHASSPHGRQFPESPASCHPRRLQCLGVRPPWSKLSTAGSGVKSTSAASRFCPQLMDKWPPDRHGLKSHLRSARRRGSAQQKQAQDFLLTPPTQSHQERLASLWEAWWDEKAWHSSMPATPAALGAPNTIRALPKRLPFTVYSGTEVHCGSTGTYGLLGGCGPPVRHRYSQGHPATPCGSDMERALDFL